MRFLWVLFNPISTHMEFSEFNKDRSSRENDGLLPPAKIHMIRRFNMAYTAGIIHPHPETVSNVYFRVTDKIHRLVSSFIEHRKFLKAEVELRGLSDQALADIGVSRSEIHTVVRTGRRSF